MLGPIADIAFVPADGGRLPPPSKADVFREFIQRSDHDRLALEVEPLPPEHETLESAGTALAFLVEQGMVVVTGDEITVPAHFWSGRGRRDLMGRMRPAWEGKMPAEGG